MIGKRGKVWIWVLLSLMLIVSIILLSYIFFFRGVSKQEAIRICSEYCSRQDLRYCNQILEVKGINPERNLQKIKGTCAYFSNNFGIPCPIQCQMSAEKAYEVCSQQELQEYLFLFCQQGKLNVENNFLSCPQLSDRYGWNLDSSKCNLFQ